jgi:hypothetical protein
VVQNLAPFRRGDVKGKALKRANNVANKTATEFRRQGWDAAEVTDAAVADRVYWGAGSVLPLCLVNLAAALCPICLEVYSNQEGMRCGGKHFVCWGCLKDLIQKASEPDASARLIDKHGNLKCQEKCNQLFALEVETELSRG